jgi:hypothetical protein
VTVGGLTIDRVLVGPNGVFAVHVDPDPRPVVVRAGYGIVRSGTRVPDGVKRAMFGAAALRAHLAGIGGDLFPYPVLVTAAPGEAGRRLGRLLVVRPERLAEAIWEHPARPLRRSVRVEVLEALR